MKTLIISYCLSFICHFSFSQNVGIGTANPQTKLHVITSDNEVARFEASWSPFISLFTNGVYKGYIWHGPASIELGSASGSSLPVTIAPDGVPRMSITTNGNVGIGTTSADFRLDVGGRMRIRSGGGSAGLFLNNNDNNASPAFIGMEDDTHVGFWGSGTNWKFTMNTQTGALKINGTEGSAGQVLRTNGAAAAPTWSNPTNLLYNNTVKLDNNIQLELITNDFVAIPGLSYTFNTATNAKVFITFSIYTHSGACFGCSASTAYIDINLDGGLADRFIETVANGSTHSFSGTSFIQVGPGPHTISFTGSRGGSNMYMGHPFQASHAVLQIIPE